MPWKWIDKSNRPYHISENDQCLYLRVHVEGGYEKSESNQLIFNLKKPVSRKGKSDWKFKYESIEKFAEELNTIGIPRNSILIPMPTSIPSDDPSYDSRIVDVITLFQRKYRPDIRIYEILDVSERIPSAHRGGTRNLMYLFDYIRIKNNLSIENNIVFLVDDVITTGAHFHVCKHLLQRQYPIANVIGIMWALHEFTE